MLCSLQNRCMKRTMTKIYKVLYDTGVNRDQLFASSSNSKTEKCQVELVSVGSIRTRNFNTGHATKLWKYSPLSKFSITEDTKLWQGHKKLLDKSVEEKIPNDLHTVMLPLALENSENLGLGK